LISRRIHWLFVTLSVLSIAAFSQGRSTTVTKAGFSPKTMAAMRAFVDTTVKEWHVAGAAVGIVKDGRIAFLEGFGRRDVAGNLPATPRTKFILGSTTKAFVTAALGLLAAEKKLDWDKPAASYLPGFRLQDEYASAHATVRDLASHRTGLPRHDLVWVNSPMDLTEMIGALRFLEPSRELRASFQYNNLMYITLGRLVEQVSGMPWDAFVRERIFKPLGMTRSGCTIPEYQAAEEYARSYRWEKEAFVLQALPVPGDKLMYGARASGSVNTTAEDMCAWITAHLGAYKAGSKSPLPAEVVLRLHTPQIPIPVSPASDRESLSPSYALGWMTAVYRGHWSVFHGGSTLDFNSNVIMFPRAGVGLVVLINASSPANDILANGLADLALGLVPIDWNKKTKDEIAAPRPDRPADKPLEGTRPAHKLEDYAGEYAHPAYGVMSLTLTDGRLRLDYKGFGSPLAHWHYETFRLTEGELEGEKLTFKTDVRGKVTAVSAALEPAVKDIVFERR
jgi:CubicO group peptidase (beta-lactamase class C family)